MDNREARGRLGDGSAAGSAGGPRILCGERLLNTIVDTRSVDISDVDIANVDSYGDYLQIGVVDDKGDRGDVTEIWRADTVTACADPAAC